MNGCSCRRRGGGRGQSRQHEREREQCGAVGWEACFLTASLVEGRTGTAHALANLRELRHLRFELHSGYLRVHGAVSRSYKHRRQHFVVTASRTSNGLSLWKRCLRDIRDCPSLPSEQRRAHLYRNSYM